MATTSTVHNETGTGQEANNDQPQDLHELTTESSNEASMGFDTKSALEIARIINHEDVKVPVAVKKAIPEIAQVIDQVARCLRDGGRLIYVTCSLFAEENEDRVAAFLAKAPDFALQHAAGVADDFLTGEGFLRLTPKSAGTDGFFVASLARAGARS